MKNAETISVLSDLIRINKDRVTGYEKAVQAQHDQDSEARDVFYKMATESRSYINELHAEVMRLGGAPVTANTLSGKIYLFWLHQQADFGGKDRHSLLTACEAGEGAVQQAYASALGSVNLPEAVQHILERQQWDLERARVSVHNLATHA
jgi:uncharacterized protein (TIGR02284 family)